MLDTLHPVTGYIFLFFIFSAVGWAIECTYRSLGERRIINSGFLYGPLCPIYGTGCLVFEIFLVPISEPMEKHLWLVLLLGVILADTVEYATSWIMEKLFHARWWDYSENFLNLHGRICFKHSCYWVIFAFVYVYLVSPMYRLAITFVTPRIINITLIVIFCVFLVDLILTVKAAADINKLMKKLSGLKATVTDFGEGIREKAGGLLASGIKPSEIFSATEKFSEWKNDATEQYIEIKKLFDKYSGTENKFRGRIFNIYDSVRKTADDTMRDIENYWSELKSEFTDNDSEML